VSMIEDHELVEKVVDTLSGLVEGDGGLTKNVSHNPQTLDEIQRGTHVEPTRQVVPQLNTSPGGQSSWRWRAVSARHR